MWLSKSVPVYSMVAFVSENVTFLSLCHIPNELLCQYTQGFSPSFQKITVDVLGGAILTEMATTCGVKVSMSLSVI